MPAMLRLLHVSTLLTDLLCLRRPLRVLLAFFWLHAVQCSTATGTIMLLGRDNPVVLWAPRCCS